MESKCKLTIVFVPADYYGSVYTCIGLGQTLLKRGHRVVFIANQTWKEKILSHGFEVEIYYDSKKDNAPEASQVWTEFMNEYGNALRMSSFDQIKHLNAHGYTIFINTIMDTDDLMTEILSHINPHVIVVDTFVTKPAVITAGVPWINLMSSIQLYYTYPGIENLPPAESGILHSPNRFIVSKGPLGDRNELSTNIWGDSVVPQTKILPLVDMVITNGGSNTVTETMLFGKPMIVMPVCFDGYDNAQRIHEKKLGIRLDPYHCEPKELLNAIETLINDEELEKRFIIISERIKNSNSKIRAAQLIEDLVQF